MNRSGLPKCSRMRRRLTGPTCGNSSNTDALSHVGVAPLPMVSHRETVRLVAHALQQQRPRVVGRQRQRVPAPGHEHFLALLGEAHEVHGHAGVAQRRVRRRELALAAVDHDEVGQRGEALVVAPHDVAACRSKRRRSTWFIIAKSS